MITTADRTRLLNRVDELVRTKYFDPNYNGRNWPELVREHRDRIVGAVADDTFEDEMNALLKRLGTSHTHFLSPRTRIPGRSSINATFHAVEVNGTSYWAFQDVQPGGPADHAGVKSGDLLHTINGEPIKRPKQPQFRMGAEATITIQRGSEPVRELRLQLKTPRPKYPECPYSEPQSVVASILDGGVGYLKVTMFPGIIGVDFARDVDRAMARLQSCDRLVIDLRGNPGGGIGALRLMSYLTPDRVPVGYSLTRRRAEQGYRREDLPRLEGIPDSKWQLPLLAARFLGRDMSVAVVTEGVGPQRFHGRIAILANEHSAGAAEMVAAFAKEQGSAILVGTNTAGRLLGGKGFKLDSNYTLMLPLGAYISWDGYRPEGVGISPDHRVEWRYEDAQQDVDRQLNAAVAAAAGERS